MQFDVTFSSTNDEFALKMGATQRVVEVLNGHSPYISEDTGTWYEYDDDAQQYVDTGVTAAYTKGEEILAALEEHTSNSDIHVTAEEKDALTARLTADEDLLSQLYIQSLYIDGAIGVLVDWETRTFTRLTHAGVLVDADDFAMYKGRRPCCVADDGTITAWIEDSQLDDESVYDVEGQVMVYQPAFYYRVYPLKVEGTVLRKAVYYVSDTELYGFKLHPAFYDVDGNAVDYILEAVYDATIWDADGGDDGTGGMVKFNNSSFTADTSADKLCSVSAASSATLEFGGALGSIIPYWATTYQTAANFETLAKNRGDGWHADRIQTESAAQLLMLIEYCTADMQTAVGRGVVDVDSSSTASSTLTDDTARLYGNSLRFIAGSGENTKENDVGYGDNSFSAYASRDQYTDPSILDGKVSVAWRYKTNPWGNTHKLLQGIKFVKTSIGTTSAATLPSRIPRITSLAGETSQAGFYISASKGYISGFGYSESHDWLFLPGETVSDSSTSIGDFTYTIGAVRPRATFVAAVGGGFGSGDSAGAFSWSFPAQAADSSPYGSRLIYVPTADSETEAAAVAAWKAQTGL